MYNSLETSVAQEKKKKTPNCKSNTFFLQWMIEADNDHSQDQARLTMCEILYQEATGVEL